MDSYGEEYLDFCRQLVTVRLTDSGVITAKPAFVFWISVCPDNGTLVYDIAIHNGENPNAPILIDLEGQFGQNKAHLCPPIYFNRGIYFTEGDNIKSITIQYLADIPH
ncbi:unnamed protein product [marine sediment metagenome]|uniref:Uncharacterized protein n=1 Tax=marine sediment metagenome TaxID=412755 RepID=X1SSM7_9ZZZZ